VLASGILYRKPMLLYAAALAMTLAGSPPNAPPPKHGHGSPDGGHHGHHSGGHKDGGHKHGGHHDRGSHGNPTDIEAYIAKLEGPDRDAHQKPAEVLKAAGVSPGQTVCDIGAGPGYFSLRMARAVGEGGTVFAVDVEPKLLAVLRDRIEKAGVKNVTPVLALPADPLLPRRLCDLIFVIDTYHHFPDGPAYLKRLAQSLKPGGKLINIDWHPGELPVGPKHDKVAREDFLTQAKGAGLELKAEHTFLPYQYFLVLEPSAK